MTEASARDDGKEGNKFRPSQHPSRSLADGASLVNFYRRLRDDLGPRQLRFIATFNSRNGYQSLGSLSDGDGKESDKKAIGLDWQNNKFYGRSIKRVVLSCRK